MRQPSVKLSLIPIIVLVFLLIINVLLFHDDSSYGPNQLALFFAAIVSGAIGVFYLKQDYKEIEVKAMESIAVSMQAMMILLVVGSLIGIWILNGVVPAMIFYGVKLIHPTVFLPVTLIICVIVSLATGSSWSTVGTVGIALVGIGQTLGVPMGMVGGAIVSGAYFGDKMSPLSDTTNLAPAMAGSDLFSHIKHMVYTSGPAVIISFILFCILGFFYSGDSIDQTGINEITGLISEKYNISLWLFTLPLLVFWLVKRKVPALPALVLGVLLGIIYALIFQMDHIQELTKGSLTAKDIYTTVLSTAYDGHVSETGNKIIDKLFSRGGMSSMLNTIWLIISAMLFGGMLEVTGMLGAIANAILRKVSNVMNLVSSTVGTALFLNITTSDQYISIVLTGRMFKSAYKEQNLAPKNLSRAVEDGATVTSVLVPWNTCGAYFSSVMGIATMTYLPFAFFNLLSPIISIIVAASGKTMEKLEE
ncbi:MAG: Na+/H+ antiporter NhaC [Halobacteriovoraceae bacterium]|nr:Na+/H+ antiporter NhaC [Halobacteriovoraceae bacterium]|tara:strand:+ start:20521 stop:21951 length:1431 start_codon:yes stop_codon:yes gene_type:complete